MKTNDLKFCFSAIFFLLNSDFFLRWWGRSGSRRNWSNLHNGNDCALHIIRDNWLDAITGGTGIDVFCMVIFWLLSCRHYYPLLEIAELCANKVSTILTCLQVLYWLSVIHAAASFALLVSFYQLKVHIYLSIIFEDEKNYLQHRWFSVIAFHCRLWVVLKFAFVYH